MLRRGNFFGGGVVCCGAADLHFSSFLNSTLKGYSGSRGDLNVCRDMGSLCARCVRLRLLIGLDGVGCILSISSFENNFLGDFLR